MFRVQVESTTSRRSSRLCPLVFYLKKCHKSMLSACFTACPAVRDSWALRRLQFTTDSAYTLVFVFGGLSFLVCQQLAFFCICIFAFFLHFFCIFSLPSTLNRSSASAASNVHADAVTCACECVCSRECKHVGGGERGL